MARRPFQWFLAVGLPGFALAHFSSILMSEDQRKLMPGETSHGHHQIELQCSVCHTPNMGVKDDSCLACHQEELARANDSHPKSKFTDPRNADRIQRLDARQCATCHLEHQPDQTDALGVTLPSDYCVFCHEDIAEERPSHAGMPFDSCATAGCHNFHDNSALYEDFLEKHISEPRILAQPTVAPRERYAKWSAERGRSPLIASDRDAPSDVSYAQDLVYEWSSTAHAAAGVNCTDCHGGAEGEAWADAPVVAACQTCHDYEAETFLQSRHGMRLAQGLSPMTPAQARLPMHAGAAHKELSCVSCHGSHEFDATFAAVQACMSCHDDAHTRAYQASPHYQLWLGELSGKAAPGSGVSCATCHLPRIEVTEAGESVTKVLHNQNDTLRPNEKMIRPVCLECHGLGFAIDAQADPALIERNYRGLPAKHIGSLEMVEEKLRKLAAERAGR